MNSLVTDRLLSGIVISRLSSMTSFIVPTVVINKLGLVCSKSGVPMLFCRHSVPVIFNKAGAILCGRHL